ncbi:hypothetical protein MASR2M54_26020 [Aliarcobacter cryaerophilus]
MDTKATIEVKAKAWTQELDKDGNPLTGTNNESNKVDISGNLAEIKAITGAFKFDKDFDLDFTKLDGANNTFKNITSIDLSENGENKLENLKLSDILAITTENNELIIKGDSDDKVSFKNLNEWKSEITEEIIDSKTFKVYTSNDESVKVKVQTEIETLI